MPQRSQPLGIQLANGTETEARTRAILLGLLDEYPLDKWRYAETVRIEDHVMPHSHPVLTLSTFHDPGNPLRLLSSYLHEQLHWFWTLEQHGKHTWEAWRQLHDAFPDFPTHHPEGCGEVSNYLHVAINSWEYLALGELIGEDRARAFLSRKPYYTAVYDIVLREGDRIGVILNDLDLMPPDLPPTDKRFVHVDDGDRDWSVDWNARKPGP